jgi:hypothetical protein
MGKMMGNFQMGEGYKNGGRSGGIGSLSQIASTWKQAGRDEVGGHASKQESVWGERKGGRWCHAALLIQ